MERWVAMDKNGDVYKYMFKPYLVGDVFDCDHDWGYVVDAALFPTLTHENSPMKIKEAE